ncbi:MAG: glycoside hydrolase family 2, partial [Bacteroidales bacterium]|nr:glycoside hydrolase family 2 [Bacteroidales bacterium]
MQGYGQAVFRNVSAPFQVLPPKETLDSYRRRYEDPSTPESFKGFLLSRMGGSLTPPPLAVSVPQVPAFNPTGAYRTSFTLPKDWKGDQVFLRFEKVASASFVWVNGQEVGYNEGAQEPAEYNVTKYLKPGKNTLAVLVLKYSDGYYLEGQDYWRLAGIFDDVTVYASPQARIWDWQVITDFGPDFGDSDLSVAVTLRGFDVQGSGYKVKATVSKEGKNVAEMTGGPVAIGPGSSQTVNLAAKVKAPEKWTADTPVLYDLEMELSDASGKTVDRIRKRIGFKKTEIRDGVFYLNGQPVKVSAQCSHMQHPTMGHAMTEEVIRRDMEILKQFNFNAVRTSHYPPVNEYLDLADEYGLYIIDETGDESHATEYVSNMPEFTEMYRERVRRMVLRDRNHACVLFWSAGNESGEGMNITEVVKEGKSLDPTRYWMYGGNAEKHPAEDIVGPRYPIPFEHEIKYGLDTKDMRPSFMDEYLSVAGNGGGAMDDFWEVIYAHPKLMGGAVWDFVSPGLTEPVRTLKDQSPNAVPAHIMGKARLVKGPTGKAIDLNKEDQWVQVYRADAVEISGDRLTLTLDILPRKFNGSGGYLLTKGEYQFGLRQRQDERLDFYLDNGQKQVLSAPLPADWEGKWHNVTAVYDGAEMRIYVDGSLSASQPMTGAIRNLPLSVCIGRSEDGCGQDTNVFICDALIDNVGIFADAVAPGSFDPSKAALWLDFEEEIREGTFWTYGLGARNYGSIWPDRTPQPEMW